MIVRRDDSCFMAITRVNRNAQKADFKSKWDLKRNGATAVIISSILSMGKGSGKMFLFIVLA